MKIACLRLRAVDGFLMKSSTVEPTSSTVRSSRTSISFVSHHDLYMLYCSQLVWFVVRGRCLTLEIRISTCISGATNMH
jgi:hypothetical protein